MCFRTRFRLPPSPPKRKTSVQTEVLSFTSGNRNRVVHLLRSKRDKQMRKVCEANERSDASVPAISTKEKNLGSDRGFVFYKRESKPHCPSFAKQKGHTNAKARAFSMKSTLVGGWNIALQCAILALLEWNRSSRWVDFISHSAYAEYFIIC